MKRFVSILAVVLVASACAPLVAQAAFGLSEFDASFVRDDGTPAFQAGSHPFAFTTSLEMNVNGAEPDGRLRDLELDEPPGFLADANAVPRCADESFEELVDGVNACPNATAVGIAESEFDTAGHRAAAPVFDLVPHAGEPMRLGFRVSESADAIVDVRLSPGPPHGLEATIEGLPEAADLFGLKLTLWGAPAAPEHDSLRGHCVGPGGESLGECPVGIGERPLLTLPTSCDGPLETRYEARSWADEWASGDAITHDGSGEPVGIGGCGALAFGPQVMTRPTTDAAASPTGLDVSVDFHDEGISNPGGLAESQVRELLIALPAEMGLAPATGETCSEAELASTSLEAPGAGCPVGSAIGNVEAESPLIEGSIVHGTVYRAMPHANLAGSPDAIYVVFEDAALGILITQPIGLERDPTTGELLGIAEETPQIPLSHLRLHLDDGENAALVNPSRCGDYRAEAELVPWATNDRYLVYSAFSVATGPGGGPCPAGEGEPAGDPAAPIAAAAGTSPPAVVFQRPPRHGCLHRARRVHHKGGARCSNKRHGKKRRGHRRNGRAD